MSTRVEETASIPQRDTHRWPVVGLLSFGMINAYFDRVCLSIALPVMVASGLDLSATQQGLALSAFFWSYTILQIPSGMLVDRYGVRSPYLWGYILWSLASAGTALTTSFGYLLFVRLLLGIGESVVTPSSMRYIRLHFSEEKRGKAVGLYMTGTKLGPAIGFPLAAYLISMGDSWGASLQGSALDGILGSFLDVGFGWRVMFLIMGLGGLIFLIPWLTWVKKDDIAALPRRRKTAEAAAGQGSELGTISARAIISSPVMWGIILGTFCYMYFVYYCLTWMPIYFFEQHNMSLKDSGWYTGASFGGMAVMIWLGGWGADWFISRGYDPINVRKAFTIAGFTFAATQTVGAFTQDVNLVLFFTVFSLCGLGLATANYWALTQTLIPGGSIAMVVGIQNTAANLAGIVAPALTGWLIDQTGSFDAPIKSVGFWLAFGVACYLFLVRRKYAPSTEA